MINVLNPATVVFNILILCKKNKEGIIFETTDWSKKKGLNRKGIRQNDTNLFCKNSREYN